jgi:hypothetical protein
LVRWVLVRRSIKRAAAAASSFPPKRKEDTFCSKVTEVWALEKLFGEPML